MANTDWKAAYLELEQAHVELWRWAGAFASGLRDHAPEAAQEMDRRFGTGAYIQASPYGAYNTIAAIRRKKLGGSDLGDTCD